MIHPDALVPALSPAARILLIQGDNEHERGSSLLSLGRGAQISPLKRVAEVAENFGHRAIFSTDFQTIDEAIPEAILLDGGARDIQEQLGRLRAHSELAGVPFITVVAGRTRDELLETLRVDGADDFLHADAHPYEILARLESAVSLSRAREQASHLREQLSRQTRVDDLTGVMSRRFFFQQAHRETSRSRRYGHKLSALMVEIDHYKSLLHTFGEGAGEQVLRSVATIIGQWTRDSDLVARFTDSKFAILLPETSIDGATTVREKIHAALQSHAWSHDGKALPVTVSIGESELQPAHQFLRAPDADMISESDENMGEVALSTREALAGLLEDADAALYIARRAAKVPDVFVEYTPANNAGEKPVQFVKAWKPGAV